MGGLTPYEPLPGCIPPPRGVPWAWAGLESGSGIAPLEIPFGVCRDLLGGGRYTREKARSDRSPSGGASPRSSPPQDGPPNLGIARIC